MLNVGKIENGIVLDHIRAGRSMSIYHHLELNKMDCPVAIIKNARSNAMGKKDILKIETDADSINLDVVAVIQCNNPRCITTVEQGVQHMFYLADPRRKIYRCRYCDERYTEQDNEW